MSLLRKFQITLGALAMLPVSACSQTPTQDETPEVKIVSQEDEIGTCFDAILAEKKSGASIVKGAIIKTAGNVICASQRTSTGLVVSINAVDAPSTEVIATFNNDGSQKITTRTTDHAAANAEYIQTTDKARYTSWGGVDEKGTPADADKLITNALHSSAASEALLTRSFRNAAMARLSAFNSSPNP